MAETPETIAARAESLVEAHQCLMDDLIEMRSRHGLSQEVVATRMGVTQPTVHAFERYDSNPTLSTIRRYALAVGARIDYTVIDDCRPTGDFIAVVRGSGANWTTSEVITWPEPGDWVGSRLAEHA